jgi:hypothetical protein
MTAEEKAAARARQEAIFASAKQEVAKKQQTKEQKFQEILNARTAPIYVNIHDEITKVYDKLENEFGPSVRESEETVLHVYSDENKLVPTIPDIIGYLPDSFATVIFEHRVRDNIIAKGDQLMVERTGIYLKAHVNKEGEDSFGVQLLDMDEGFLTRKRLSGSLIMGTGEAEGRLIFSDDPDVFIHPSVAQQKDSSLRQLVNVVRDGVVLDVTYPRE